MQILKSNLIELPKIRTHYKFILNQSPRKIATFRNFFWQ